MDYVLLNIIASPSLEGALVDWLLGRPDSRAFTSIIAAGHGARPGEMSVAEQVEGRKDQIMFQVYLSRENARRVVADLGEEFGDAKLHYWILPAVEGGPIGA